MSARWRQAAGGLFGVAVLLAASVTVVAFRAGAWRDEPELTLVVPASAGPLRAQSPVQFRGIVVGTVTEVRGGPRESVLTLAFTPDSLETVPAGVKARLLPRTLFGDQYVDLAGTGAPGLAAGGRIPHDDSARSVQLYEAATRLYDLLSAVRPSELSAALNAVADALRGKGEHLGRLIDDAHAVAGAAGPELTALLAELPKVSTLTGELARSAPDLFRALDDAVAISDTFVARQDDFKSLLLAGADVGAAAEALLLDNTDRTIKIIQNAAPVLDTAAAHPGALTATVNNLGSLLDAVGRAFAHGPWVKLEAPVTLDSPRPYTAEDCPRYGSLAGPNCGTAPPPPEPLPLPEPTPPGGTVGPVGGAPEKEQLRQLFPSPPGRSTLDLLGLLAGPILRGGQVRAG
ncbi:MCE family protein [Amycolatopsis albispora]|uniref:Uncharacterized protein n=1 Tax=Amycolatopsis albispora TaxID=1804986 RepID=A0A344L527_9PSEU|nr:MCE family protein [Amycolatopsis albispora]AXB43151.1 hypothetical protein A4R43_11805 [Amycolatopsis albispora]